MKLANCLVYSQFKQGTFAIVPVPVVVPGPVLASVTTSLYGFCSPGKPMFLQLKWSEPCTWGRGRYWEHLAIGALACDDPASKALLRDMDTVYLLLLFS